MQTLDCWRSDSTGELTVICTGMSSGPSGRSGPQQHRAAGGRPYPPGRWRHPRGGIVKDSDAHPRTAALPVFRYALTRIGR